MYPVNAVTAVQEAAGCALEQDPEMLRHLNDPVESAPRAAQEANHIVHLLKIRHRWAASLPGVRLTVANGMCEKHELRRVGALPANEMANPAELCAANPDPQGFCSGSHGVQLISGNVVKQGDPFHATQAAVVKHLQAV